MSKTEDIGPKSSKQKVMNEDFDLKNRAQRKKSPKDIHEEEYSRCKSRTI